MPGGGGGAAPPAGREAVTPTPRRAEEEAAAAAVVAVGREVAVRAGTGAAAAAVPAAVRSAQELAEARRRLLEAEGRRHLVSELERRVEQLHRVFLEAELRLAPRAESLSRLGGGVAQAELYLSAHGQRLKKSLRRPARGLRPPALLASALRLGSCVPWAAGRLRRAPESPDSPFRRINPPRPQP